jgi:MFS family permease
MTHRRYWVYFLLFLLNTISYTDRVNMSLAGHLIATDFHLTPVALGYLFSSFLWAYVLVMLVGGWLIDRIGMHRVSAICATIWSLAQIGTGAAGSFGIMLLTRLGLGVGEAPVSPISYRAVRDWGPFTEHGTAIGAIQAGTLLGPALGAPLVAWLISATSWQVSSMPPASLVWSGWWCGPRWSRRRNAHAGCRSRSGARFSPSGTWRGRSPRPVPAAAIAA